MAQQQQQPKDRAVAGILGAIIADAAGLGTHWHYKDNAPEEVAGGPNVAFAAPDELYTQQNKFCFFAHGGKQIGDLTHRGEGILAMLRTLAKAGLQWDSDAYATEFAATWGAGGTWSGWVDHSSKVTLLHLLAKQLEPRVDSFGLSAEWKGKASHVFAEVKKALSGDVSDPAAVVAEANKWIAGNVDPAAAADPQWAENKPAFLKVVAALAADANSPFRGDPSDSQVHALISALPLFALVALTPEQLEDTIRFEQDTDASVSSAKFFYRLVREVLVDGAKIADVIRSVREWPEVKDDAFVQPLVAKAFDAESTDHKAFVKENGKSCMLTGVIPGVVHILLQKPGDYEEAVQETLRAGGDNAARAAFVGLLIGASEGYEAIPRQWQLKTQRWVDYAEGKIAEAQTVSV